MRKYHSLLPIEAQILLINSTKEFPRHKRSPIYWVDDGNEHLRMVVIDAAITKVQKEYSMRFRYVGNPI